MPLLPPRLIRFLVLPVLPLLIPACSSCEVPREPVLPADMTGIWEGSYTLYDGVGRALTDSLRFEIESNRGQISGEGTRRRFLPEEDPMVTPIEITGAIVVNTFRIELIDTETRNRAVFSGSMEGDTLSGRLSVDGSVVGELRMVGQRGLH